MRSVARILLTCATASFFGSLLLTGGPSRTPWRAILMGALAGFVFSSCCALFATIALPGIMPRIRGRLRPPYTWMALVATLVGIAAVGSFVPVLGAAVLGFIPFRAVLRMW